MVKDYDQGCELYREYDVSFTSRDGVFDVTSFLVHAPVEYS